MNIFCNDSGNILSVTPEKIYQNSAGVNIIRFIGQFPTSAQVLMAYKLPNGDFTMPKMLAFVQEVEAAKVDGGKFGVWEGRIGASPKIDTETGKIMTDENGQVLYDLDYTITQNYGTANMQFYVYAANGGQLATASTSFVIEKGVPMDLPDISNPDNAELLEQILSVVANTQELYGNVETELETLKLEIENAIPTTEKGQPNGVASLNAQGQVPSTQLPPLNYLPLTGGTIDGMLRVAGKITVDGYGSESGVSPNTTATTSIRRDGLEVDVIVADHPNYWYDYTLYSHSGIYQKVRNNVYEQKLPQGNGTLALQEIVDAKIKVLEQAITQAGIIYTADDVNVWNERVTAAGANVLDGSKAVLKKVVGSTVKCNNLIPFPYEYTTYSTNGVTITVNNDGSFIIDGTPTAKAYSGIINLILKAGTYTLSANYTDANADGILAYLTYVKNPSDADKAIYLYYGKTTFTVDTETEYRLTIRLNNGVAFNKRQLTVMLNAGEAVLPYEKYFTGLKNASFAGIESMGSNLFNAKAVKNTNIKVNDDGSEILLPLVTAGNGQVGTQTTLAELCPSLRVGDVVYMDYEESVVSGNDMIYLTASGYLWYCGHSRTITEQDLASNVSFYGNRYMNGYTEQVTLLNFRIVKVKNAPFAPYIEPTVLSFPKTELGEWDSIDFENKKIIEGSKEIVLDGTENWVIGGVDTTGEHRFVLENFVEQSGENSVVNSISSVYESKTSGNTYSRVNGLSVSGDRVYIYDNAYATKTADEFKAHLAKLYASGNPVTVRYLFATPTETPFTAQQSASGNEYTAYKGGTERVLGNNNAKFGANNELTINYVYITEVE